MRDNGALNERVVVGMKGSGWPPVTFFFLMFVGFCFFYFLKKDFIYLFLERGQGREKERERNINVWLLPMWPLLGTWPTTQACALTGNRTGNPLVHSPHSIH